MKKTILLISAGLILIIALIIGGRYDYNINHEQAPASMTIEDSTEDFGIGVTILNDSIDNTNMTVDRLFVMVKKLAEMSRHQRSELIYNTEREIWDTVYVSQLYEAYMVNPAYYDSMQ